MLLIEIQFFDGPLDERDLVIGIEDDKRSIETQRCQVVSFDAQNTGANSVKGTDIHFFGLVDAHQFFQAFAHLPGSLVGKCDGQDAPWRDMFVLYEVGNAVRDYAGFAAAWPCQDENGSFGGSDCFLLRLIESGQQVSLFQHHHLP